MITGTVLYVSVSGYIQVQLDSGQTLAGFDVRTKAKTGDKVEIQVQYIATSNTYEIRRARKINDVRGTVLAKFQSKSAFQIQAKGNE